MRVVRFEAGHFDNFVFREHDLLNNSMGCTDRDSFLACITPEFTYSIFKDDMLLSIAGGLEVMKGNVYTWQTPREGFEKHVVSFVKGLRKAEQQLIDDTKCHRLFTICPDEQKYFNWMTKGVGYQLECELENYGGVGVNMIQYKRMV